MGLTLFRQQVQLADLYFFIFRIAGQLDNFHSVQQRRRDSFYRVSGYDPENMGKIEGEFDIVITEGVVLFRVQHFQQS